MISGNRLKGFRTLRAQVFWSLIPIMFFLVVLLCVIDLRQQRLLAEEEFMKQGEAKAANIAERSKLAVFTEDGALVAAAIKSVSRGADFGYLVIYGENWKVLGQAGELVLSEMQLLSELSDEQKGRLLSQQKLYVERVASQVERFVDFVVPILIPDPNTPYELELAPAGQQSKHAEQVRERVSGVVRLGLTLKNVDSRLAVLLRWRIGLIVAFLLLSTLVVYVFSSKITRPIKQLTAHAIRIAGGHLDHDIPVESRDEIGQLAVTFNTMARSLEGNISEKQLALTQLRELNQTLEHRIRQRTEAIEAMNSQLRQATRHKSEFLANVNHELRTPVSAIIGYARLILRKTEGQISSGQKQNLRDLLVTAEQLLQMINGLLDLAKIEAGRMDVYRELVSIEELVHEAASPVEAVLKPDLVRLVRDIQPELPAIKTDREKLRQIILNLLTNAAKFTEKGVIKVSAARENGSVRMIVSDTGIGIKREDLGSIFEEFRQGPVSNGRKYAGTGLGLAIVKRYLDLLGGDIGVESEVGKGTTVTVTLPLDNRTDI